MNQILLEPTDVLFFKDGRPMGSSLAGNGAAWPLPTVTNAALHAALWRSGLAEDAHAHGRDGHDGPRTERFGSLVTAGPFPVDVSNADPAWFFPAPADARVVPEPDGNNNPTGKHRVDLTHAPSEPIQGSSNHVPLPLNVASRVPPTKDTLAKWWNRAAWEHYVGAASSPLEGFPTRNDSEFSDEEAAIGIGIDPDTGTQDGQRFYSAHYLRLHPTWRLGLIAGMSEKQADASARADLLPKLIRQEGAICVGGQQRVCTAMLQPIGTNTALPLPVGRSTGFDHGPLLGAEAWLVKWILLSPAIWPKLEAQPNANPPVPPHPGGWLPNWIEPGTFNVKLRRTLPPRDPVAESRADYRARLAAQPFIDARLVAALVPKPIPVTGWGLGAPDLEEADRDGRKPGARPTHLAVPAGAVYYFSCNSPDAAHDLAVALNWHGDSPGTVIRNRRSTLFGEKGFGLGVCGTWSPYPTTPTT